jgi:hypothetical protein
VSFAGLGWGGPTSGMVGNGLGVVRLVDPDGYRIEFESPTDLPEEDEFEG